jgi:hypothetical protein
MEKNDFLKRKIAYVAGSYSSNKRRVIFHNILQAVNTASFLRKSGHVCIVPHLESLYHEDTLSEGEWIKHGLKLLSICDLLVVYERQSKSKGTGKEIIFALENKIPIFYFDGKMLERICGISKKNELEYCLIPMVENEENTSYDVVVDYSDYDIEPGHDDDDDDYYYGFDEEFKIKK